MPKYQKIPTIITDLLYGGIVLFAATVLVCHNASASTWFLPNGEDCGMEEWSVPDEPIDNGVNPIDCHDRWRPHSNCFKCSNGWYACGECEENYV
ncbi:MAG: hypothetical protein J6Y91_00695, partial [Alphaproteobacteria bacterium]|nr:hypothetical protein [Alphaproteobacteria bacterium]